MSNPLKKKTSYGFTPFIAAFILLTVVYAIFFNDCWAIDHVGNYDRLGIDVTGVDMYYIAALAGGRFMTIFYDKFFAFVGGFGINKLSHEWVFQLLLIILLAVSVQILYSLFEKYFSFKNKEFVLPLVFCIAFVNPLFVETFLFEACELAVSIVAQALATKLFAKKKYIASILLVFVSVATYQSHISLFFIWSTLYIYLEYGDNFSKNGMIELLKSWGIGVIPLGIDMAVMTYFSSISPRGDVLTEGTTSKVKDVFRGWYHMYITGLKLMPTGFMAIFIAVVLGLCLIVFIVSKKKLTSYIYLALVVAALNGYFVAIALAGYNAFYGRILWPGYAAVTAMVLIAVHIVLTETPTESAYKTVIFTILILYGMSQIFFTERESSDVFIANKLDAEIAGIVQNHIEEYEAEGGQEITTIKTWAYEDSNRYDKYLLKNSPYEFAYKNLSLDTLSVDLINFTQGTSYEKLSMTTEEYESIFKNQEMKEFNPSKQLYFQGDTLYWVVY